MGQNAFSQLDCRIFKSTISPEQIDQITWFFIYWYKFMKIKTFNQIFLGGYGEKWFDQFGHVTQKCTVSQKLTDGINSIFTCWYKYRKTLVGVVCISLYGDSFCIFFISSERIRIF